MTGFTRQSSSQACAIRDREVLTLDTRDDGSVRVGLEPRNDCSDGRVRTLLVDRVAKPRWSLSQMTRTLFSILRSRQSINAPPHQ